MQHLSNWLGLATAAALVSSLTAANAQDMSKVQLHMEKVADGIYMLQGLGGNIGLSVGEDGVLMVDDQFAPLSPKIESAIRAVSDKPVRFVINTHWHFDHTGGNEHFGKMGAVTVSHENVRKRMSVDSILKYIPIPRKSFKAKTGLALPIVTFHRNMTFHMNGQTIQVSKLPNSHTDGDSVVRFTEANVLHVGDVLRTGYPFIDVANGGTLQGTIDASNVILGMMDQDTKVISGHAPVIGRAEVIAYRDMLETVKTRISALVASGKSEADIIAGKPLADLDPKWGKGFIKAEILLQAVISDLTGKDR